MLVSWSMNELVRDVGMVELGFFHEMSHVFIFFNSRDNTLAAKLQLSSSGQPCANPSPCLKCQLGVSGRVLCIVEG